LRAQETRNCSSSASAFPSDNSAHNAIRSILCDGGLFEILRRISDADLRIAACEDTGRKSVLASGRPAVSRRPRLEIVTASASMGCSGIAHIEEQSESSQHLDQIVRKHVELHGAVPASVVVVQTIFAERENAGYSHGSIRGVCVQVISGSCMMAS